MDPSRYATIDGLRGLAALSVVFFHLRANLETQLAGWLNGWVSAVMFYGYLGVPVFFVLSGFVITLSVGPNRITPSFAGRFAARRSIRLDPPYWASIALVIALAILTARFFPEFARPLPSAAKIAAHVGYLQNFLGYGDISPMYWTLCYEIQFYIFLLALLWIGQRLGSTTEILRRPVVMLFFATTAIVSACVHGRLLPWSVRGLALESWYCFALGMSCYWAIRGWVDERWFVALWISIMGIAVVRGNANDIAALAASALLFIGGKRERLHAWLSERSVQFLGRISYSMYLFHAPIGWAAISLFKHIVGAERMGVGMTGLALFIGVFASVLSAEVAYLLLERPSVRLSRRVSVIPKQAPPASPEVVPV